MPQMAPLWWEILFLMFISCFMLMNTLIYFNKISYPKQNSSKYTIIHQFKWKW